MIEQRFQVGATTLLIDEDTCATNFMIRDGRMQQLVEPSKEPITPFIQKVRDHILTMIHRYIITTIRFVLCTKLRVSQAFWLLAELEITLKK